MGDLLVPLALPVHTFTTLAMVGVIWTVQLVHYPLMSWPLLVRDGRAAFDGWHARHLRWMTWVAVPLMLTEAAAALILLEHAPPSAPPWAAPAGALLLLAVWISTAALQVPAHRRLERGWDARTHARLVRGNWIRTLAWTARGILALALAGQA